MTVCHADLRSILLFLPLCFWRHEKVGKAYPQTFCKDILKDASASGNLHTEAPGVLDACIGACVPCSCRAAYVVSPCCLGKINSTSQQGAPVKAALVGVPDPEGQGGEQQQQQQPDTEVQAWQGTIASKLSYPRSR